MMVLNIVTGLFLIGMGILVKSYPNLISGYNTLPPEKKKKVDIKGLSTFLRNGFALIGMAIIVIPTFFYFTGLLVLSNVSMVAIILVGVLTIAILSLKFDRNKKGLRQIIPLVLLGITIAFVAMVILYGLKPVKISIQEQTINIEGMYGCTINTADIEEIKLIDSMPQILLRTNGFHLGTTYKGYFALSGFPKVKLFIQNQDGPFLMLSTKHNNIYIINFAEINETKRLHTNLVEAYKQLAQKK
ncbi:MAG TPA: DUF3784 domain-containing protein [Tenuifilaceae bacterium]|nr:DUF3784 domain-containing protein [Tenuifilaceae bacterium]HPE18059.1 DUF3784 domain-containing protein [Tenuifilaceae bacterium]HPJ44578.1 DUF3784 domain-containing protein [Tenuifilaceae bacterium]HPQ34470.1 DUF3784 domain-containing protein [Tenuifilaceae bacterium]HRX68781.1 DUF3784 domain-containing protein [Tenuifilaceae bacterium]